MTAKTTFLCCVGSLILGSWPSLWSWVLWIRVWRRTLLSLSQPTAWCLHQAFLMAGLMGLSRCWAWAWFPPNMTLWIKARKFNLGFSRPENFGSNCLKEPLHPVFSANIRSSGDSPSVLLVWLLLRYGHLWDHIKTSVSRVDGQMGERQREV